MKKLVTLFVALAFTASMFAEKIYFQTTSDCNWMVDEAKLGAIFRTGMTDADYGVFTDYFTPVEGQEGLYCADIPVNEEPWQSVQFLRYSNTAASATPIWGDFWNGTGIETFDGAYDLFTATSWGTGQLTTTGTWSVYEGGSTPTPTPTPTPGARKVYLDAASGPAADNNWEAADAKFFVMFAVDSETSAYTNFMTKNAAGYWEAEVPEGDWNTFIFFRADPTQAAPDWAYWNRSCEMNYDEVNNLFIVRTWDGCTDSRDADAHCSGDLKAYGSTPVEEVAFEGSVYSQGNTIFANFEGEAEIVVCTLTGKLLDSTKAEGSYQITVPTIGNYVIKIGDFKTVICVK